jgi:hypothetical protein
VGGEQHVAVSLADVVDHLSPLSTLPACQAYWAFPVHRRNFVRQSDIAFVNKQLENTRKNRSFGENP